MLVSHFFDLVPIWALLTGTILLMIAFIELGFRLGKNALVWRLEFSSQLS